MQSRAFLSLALGAAFLAAGCNSDNNSTGLATNSTANVRLVNASSTTPLASAAVGNTSLVSNLAFQNVGASSNCVTVPTGNQTINFTNGSGSTVGSAAYNFQAGQNYTVLLYGGQNGAQTQAIVLPDQFTAPTSGNMGVRFINATGSAGDIYATTSGGTVSGSPLMANVSPFSSTSTTTWSAVPTTNNSFYMYNAGTTVNSTATPSARFNLSTVPTNGVSTVIFTPSATTGGSTGFSVGTC